MTDTALPMTARPVASFGRTAALCAIVAALALAGFLTRHQGTGAASPSQHPQQQVGIFVSLIGGQYLMFQFVRATLRGVGLSLGALVSVRPLDRRTLLRDLVLGVLLLAFWQAIAFGLTRLLGPGDLAAVGRLSLSEAWEVPVWLVVSACAGVVEELAFRGLLQRQIAYLSGATWIGVVAQAVLFGAAHLYQGPVLAAQIAVFGLLFGIVAALRGSLVPGMVAHGLEDALAAFVDLG
ncbi:MULTISPECIES: CPBP family intramembrane glutamic endopeptidase [Gluconacetobacter]|uniref:CPBP family intramembrane glutamic endopeptidase n=1 Tax=Gluconacetobacter TaxID=89583 RepID=UPI001FE7E324|nr:CPBP family intramembrane glutamic endopeptidase [Gluconacetobacter dulcium]